MDNSPRDLPPELERNRLIQKLLVYMTHPQVDAWVFKPRHREILERRLPGLEVIVASNSKEFIARLAWAEAAVVWYFRKDWLTQARNLRLIVTPAAGRDWIEPEETPGLAIWFGGFHGPMIAESVAGAMLYFAKAFGLSREMQRRKKWARLKISNCIRSLGGARVTILGFGKIGQAIGRCLKAFGCQIAGVRRHVGERPDYFTPGDQVVTVGELAGLLPRSDHLILTLPGGPETRGFLTRDYLRMLPAGSFLYNVGRGNACCEGDLVEALLAGNLAGAYLDVFEEEPLPEESRLWEMENVLIQPHLSAAAPEYLDRFADELADKLLAGGASR